MTSRTACFRLLARPLALVLLLTLSSLACSLLGGGPYHETFDSIGDWGSASDSDVVGGVNGGVYELQVLADSGLYWSTAGENFADATFEVEATQVDGPLDNGYGMMFRVNNETDTFYLFEVSGDGFVWIGRCADSCNEVEPLVNNGWMESAAVKQGLQQTNTLRVDAESLNMTFFVNGQEVGRISDTTLDEGDIAVMVETLGEGGVKVAFDNFKVTPIE